LKYFYDNRKSCLPIINLSLKNKKNKPRLYSMNMNINLPPYNGSPPPMLYRQWTVQVNCQRCGRLYQDHHSFRPDCLKFLFSTICLNCADRIISPISTLQRKFRAKLALRVLRVIRSQERRRRERWQGEQKNSKM